MFSSNLAVRRRWVDMFEKMQYIIDLRDAVSWNEYQQKVLDSERNLLGHIISGRKVRPAQYRYKDKDGFHHGEVRREQIRRLRNLLNISLKVYGPSKEVRGEILFPVPADYKNKITGTSYFGLYTLYDSTGKKIAISNRFSYPASWMGDTHLDKFDYLRWNGLSIKAPDGSTIATIQRSPISSGCKVEILSPSVDKFLMMSLVTLLLN